MSTFPPTSLATDGVRIAAGLLDGRVRVWSADGVLQQEVAAHTARVSSLAFDGSVLWSASWDGTARPLHLDRVAPSVEEVVARWGMGEVARSVPGSNERSPV